MKKHLFSLLLLCTAGIANAQYNTISGTVWAEGDDAPNGIRDTSEPLVAGILANLVDNTSGEIVASAISNNFGVYTLNNYVGAGTYHIDFSFPSTGYTITALRTGAINTVNNAADPSTAFGNVVQTLPFVISSTTNLNTYGLGLVRVSNSITYYVYKASTSTDWSQTFMLPKSNDALYGVTNRAVIFTTNASFYPSLGIENTSPTMGSPTASISSNGALKLTLPTVPTLDIDASSPTKNASLTAYDGTTDYGGTSGISFVNQAGSGIAQRQYTTASDLSSYFRSAGTATFSIPANVTRTSTFSGGGNLQAVSTANSAAGVFVTYRYPAPVFLPISLLNFNAKKNIDEVEVSWQVATQTNTRNYLIERSADGKIFKEIGTIASNDRSGLQSYQFIDLQPLAGKNIYRLKQMDATGTAKYSSVALVMFGGNNTTIKAYPNPANNSLTVQASTGSKIMMYNSLGQVQKIQFTVNESQIVINTSNLRTGNYILQVVTDGVSNTQQVTIQHP